MMMNNYGIVLCVPNIFLQCVYVHVFCFLDDCKEEAPGQWDCDVQILGL
jgi:hypothetical protein